MRLCTTGRFRVIRRAQGSRSRRRCRIRRASGYSCEIGIRAWIRRVLSPKYRDAKDNISWSNPDRGEQVART